jgi:hypothetical protein
MLPSALTTVSAHDAAIGRPRQSQLRPTTRRIYRSSRLCIALLRLDDADLDAAERTPPRALLRQQRVCRLWQSLLRAEGAGAMLAGDVLSRCPDA